MPSKIHIRLNPGVLPLLGAMLIWGLSFIAIKIALQDFLPFTLNVLRLVIAWIVLFPFARREGYRLRDTLRPDNLFFGLTGVAVFYTMETIGLQLTSVASASLIQAAIPALTAFFSFLILQEHLTIPQACGVVLSVLGVVVITLAGGTAGGQDSLAGNGFIVLSALAWVAYTLQGKKWSQKVSSLVATTSTMAAGLIFLLPWGICEVAVNGLPRLTLSGLLALSYLALGGSAAAYYLWNLGLRHMNASQASPFINLIPVIGLVSAMVWGETVSLVQLAGGAAAIIGVWLSGKVDQRSNSLPAPVDQS